MEPTGSKPIVIIPLTPKRKRSPNWELTEKALLKECIKDYIADIENKAVDTNTTKSKQKAWQLLHKRFNELNSRERSVPEIKQQWRTMKLEAKKSFSDYKKSCKLTGGGEKPPSPNQDTQNILSLIPQEFEEDENVFDSDGLLHQVKTIAMEPKDKTAPSENNDVNDVEQTSQPCNDEQNMTKENIYAKVNLKRKLPKHKFSGKKEVKHEMSKRDAILIECIREESKLKIQQMTEAHEWARKEHLLRLNNLELENKISLVFCVVPLINCSLFIISVTMSQLRTLFMLLQEDFKEVIESKDVDVKLKHIIKRHSTLSKLLNELGDTFGAILAIHVLFLSITICFYGIAARVYGRLEDFKNFLVAIITIINIYHCCRNGQNATDSAMDIEKAIYSSSWVQLSLKNKKIILLTMMRAQRATYICSLKLIEISMKTFVTIMNTSWSFLSLFTTMYED